MRPAPSGAVRCYDMESLVAGILDDTGSDNDDGAVTGATQVTGYLWSDHALSFANANAGNNPTDYVDIPDWTQINGLPFTISAFIKCDTSQYLTLCAFHGGAYDYCYECIQVHPNGTPRFSFSQTVDGTWYPATEGISVGTGVYFHFVIRRDHTTLEYYVNGVKLGNTVTIPNYSFGLNTLGAMTLAPSFPSLYIQHMAGDVDQFRIYNRALTDEEITLLYEEVSSPFYDSAHTHVAESLVVTVDSRSAYPDDATHQHFASHLELELASRVLVGVGVVEVGLVDVVVYGECGGAGLVDVYDFAVSASGSMAMVGAGEIEISEGGTEVVAAGLTGIVGDGVVSMDTAVTGTTSWAVTGNVDLSNALSCVVLGTGYGSGIFDSKILRFVR